MVNPAGLLRLAHRTSPGGRRPWHLAGRFTSRTFGHRAIDQRSVGIPAIMPGDRMTGAFC